MNGSVKTFVKWGNKYSGSSIKRSAGVAQRRFKSLFGVTANVCSTIWEKIVQDIPEGGKPKHLLWALLFLKQYSDEHTRRSIVGADEKTIRKWTWKFVELLSNMNVVILFSEILNFSKTEKNTLQIIFENRFNMSVAGQTAYVSLDGVDFKIDEPKPFSRLWYSHKFKPGLRYEIGLNIRAGHIVWSFGGYPCGEFPDLKLSKELYVPSVKKGEKTLADQGYKDSNFFILPNIRNKLAHSRIMGRHETVNKRIRHFLILKKTFRHDRAKHPMVFHAVVNITQIVLENGEPLFEAI